MDLDWIIFPAPDPSYSPDKMKVGDLIFIPKKTYPEFPSLHPSTSLTNFIPCLLLRATTNSLCPKYAIFFHGNAEDINLAYEMLSHIRFTLSINVIAPEFPGYGIYSGYPTEDQIYSDSLSVYDYMVNTMKISQNNIIVFGRSLGTAVATYLASQRMNTALVLISPSFITNKKGYQSFGVIFDFFSQEKFYKKRSGVSKNGKK